MIALTIQDKYDNSEKVAELRGAIGQKFSDNKSSTLNSILLSVSECGNKCTTKEARSDYNNKQPKKGTFTAHSWLTWNAIFS